MLRLSPLLLLLLFLSFLPPTGPSVSAHSGVTLVTAQDRKIGAVGSRLAGSSPVRAIAWLNRQQGIARAEFGSDRATVDVRFRDGAEVAIVPSVTRTVPLRRPGASLFRLARTHAVTSNLRATVLEPFADELNLGPAPGQQEANLLSESGFSVDVKRNADVTVETMEALGGYSFVYIETHAGALAGGDAIVVTGQVSPAQINSSPYASMFADHSLMQAFVAGQSQPILYSAITSIFVQKHMGIFPTSSIVFLNGCEILAAPVFWSALQAKNVGTLISWDQQVYSDIDERAAAVVLSQMQTGGTVVSGISAAQAQGLATSIGGGTIAHLGFLGYADNTLGHALAGDIVPTITPTPTLTSTATPAPVSKPRVKCKRGTKLVQGKCRKVKAKPTPKPTPSLTPKPKTKKHCKKKRCKR